jgi:hypothetical protein
MLEVNRPLRMMSAPTPIVDIRGRDWIVRYVPLTDIQRDRRRTLEDQPDRSLWSFFDLTQDAFLGILCDVNSILSMEGAMPNRESQLPSNPMVEVVLNGIANWVSKYRHIIGLHNQLGQCEPDEVMRVARDLGVTSNDLLEFERKGPGAADLLQKMLFALHVDPKVIANTDPQIMRDLQRLCITCSEKKRCEHELANGTASEHFRDFCPNAFTLDALFDQKG